MDEKVFELSFEIIGYAGNAKGIAFEAIEKAKSGDIDGAREMLKESKDESNKAHRCQTELIQQEASGNKVEMSVVLVHAQDHLMNTMNYQMLAESIIDLHEKIVKLENK
ncbi:PTS lactose/cellobiose transporter subunit IIA [Romboutsia weinsteinii]|uniref:PTS lactose/cellobiose transporter subunit IIA n=1 Tax=Romboutsia weinsteinii TaxID=2020949 RepID=A0A371J3F3_9FIRM|nr:PTS lactose/cellobiose transporter subunit IIA [Romboutsia weinsteinii]RDY27311.1 PTS lactose/cellobiose transporter subunit IIA [Romboutsia weinsteinii]